MPFSRYLVFGERFTFGPFKSVLLPPAWRDLTDREKVRWALDVADRLRSENYSYGWITTPAFYEVGLNLFRNEISKLRKEGYDIENLPVEGIRADGRPRKWHKYRLEPKEKALF